MGQALESYNEEERATFNGILPPRYIEKNYEFEVA
jgi:hypothetical protein